MGCRLYSYLTPSVWLNPDALCAPAVIGADVSPASGPRQVEAYVWVSQMEGLE